MINSSIHSFVNSIGGSTVVQDSLNHPKVKGSCLASATKAPALGERIREKIFWQKTLGVLQNNL
jgi:hypothetical protein